MICAHSETDGILLFSLLIDAIYHEDFGLLPATASFDILSLLLAICNVVFSSCSCIIISDLQPYTSSHRCMSKR